MKIETKFDVGDIVHVIFEGAKDVQEWCQECKRYFKKRIEISTVRKCRVRAISIYATGVVGHIKTTHYKVKPLYGSIPGSAYYGSVESAVSKDIFLDRKEADLELKARKKNRLQHELNKIRPGKKSRASA